MGDSLDNAINDIIAASMTATDFLSRLASRPTEMRVELPSVAERLDKEFFPPLPGRLFTRLAPLPGKAFAVYMVLRLRSRLEKKPTVTLTTAYLRRFGITRRQKEHALVCLEAAELLTIDRTNGKNPRITLRREHVPWIH
jgi:hypothetical protein